jgi:hypothetical protein
MQLDRDATPNIPLIYSSRKERGTELLAAGYYQTPGISAGKTGSRRCVPDRAGDSSFPGAGGPGVGEDRRLPPPFSEESASDLQAMGYDRGRSAFDPSD